MSKNRKPKDKVFRTSDETVQDFFNQGRLELLNECLDEPKRILPLHHQIRIYSQLPPEYQEKVDPKVKAAVEWATDK